MSDVLTEQTAFQIADQVITEEIEDELVVLDLEGDDCFSLNDVGRFIWERAAEGNTFSEIVDAICNTYEVDRQRAEADARAFLENVVDEGLVRPV